ncbi:MAG: hypothetical protein KF833_06675 [Verrucomicrobiae bacterium]|nr:hypothetical protein [Verrucomicrobiae bacterium]
MTLDVALLEQAAGPASESLPPDVAYNRQWARSLLNVVFRRLREEWAASDRLGLFEQLEPHLWGDVTAVPYPDLAQRFGLTQVNLRVMLHRLRQRYRSILLETVAQTVADPAEVDGELQFLIQVLRQ